MKKISCSVFRSNIGDCSNGGITNKFDTLNLYSDVNTAEDLANIPEGSLVLIKRDLFGRSADYVVPVQYAIIPFGNVMSKSVMFGGCFVWCSDSRFRELSQLPLPVHDRVE